MKKLIALFMALFFIAGCSLSTIEPHRRASEEPVKKGIIKSIMEQIKPSDDLEEK